MSCTFEPYDDRFCASEEPSCPVSVGDVIGSVPVDGGPPRVLLGETEGIEVWGIAEFFEREQLMDDLEREATERLRAPN